MKCIVFGHSHMTTMLAAARNTESVAADLGVEFRLVQFPWLKAVVPSFHRTVDRGVVANDALMLALEQAGLYDAGEVVLCSVVTGNDNHVLGMLQNERPFDFILPCEPHLPFEKGAEFICYDAVETTLRNRIDSWLPFLVVLKGMGKRVIQIESPPPIGDDAVVAARLDPFFKTLSDAPKIAPRNLRYKFWRALSIATRSACAENGIEYLPAPTIMQDGSGFLSEPGWYTDATHGSPAYSEAVLRGLKEFLQPREGALNL
jgi:hypothetical protein